MADEVPLATGDFAAGVQVAGYRLAEQIGWGGMAVVYRALDVRLDRWVALKILAPEIARDESFRQRFISESRAAAAVDHPHIIPVFEAGEAGRVLFIAMRYVSGDRLERNRTTAGRPGASRPPADRVPDGPQPAGYGEAGGGRATALAVAGHRVAHPGRHPRRPERCLLSAAQRGWPVPARCCRRTIRRDWPGQHKCPGRAQQPDQSGRARSASRAARPAGPAATVRSYVAAINRHDYRRAWHLGGRNSSPSYATFAQGFGSTATDSLIILSVDGNVVTARLIAVHNDGSIETYQGTYAVEDGVITEADVAQIG